MQEEREGERGAQWLIDDWLWLSAIRKFAMQICIKNEEKGRAKSEEWEKAKRNTRQKQEREKENSKKKLLIDVRRWGSVGALLYRGIYIDHTFLLNDLSKVDRSETGQEGERDLVLGWGIGARIEDSWTESQKAHDWK